MKIAVKGKSMAGTYTKPNWVIWMWARLPIRTAWTIRKRVRHTTRAQKSGRMSPTVTSRTYGHLAALSTKCFRWNLPLVDVTWTTYTSGSARESFHAYPTTTQMTFGRSCSSCLESILPNDLTVNSWSKVACFRSIRRNWIAWTAWTSLFRRLWRVPHPIAHKSPISRTHY